MNVNRERNACLQPPLEQSAMIGGTTTRFQNEQPTDNAKAIIRNERVTKTEDNTKRNPDKLKPLLTAYEYFTIK